LNVAADARRSLQIWDSEFGVQVRWFGSAPAPGATAETLVGDGNALIKALEFGLVLRAGFAARAR
jgi:hypothetical protein